MNLCKTHVIPLCFFLLATVPAYCQRGTIGIDVGQTSDKFGGSARNTDLVGDLNGQLVVVQGSEKEGNPNVVVGGEMRFPSNTQNHASEYALFGGVMFGAHSAFSAGFHVQVRKILVPPSTENGETLNRDNMELLELPLVVHYRFGPGRNAFVEAQGAPEFKPHFKASSAGASPLPNPNFDYGYTLRGSVGYIFGKWYARGNYETRYFKFTQSSGNPNGLYNWRTDAITGGVGFVF